MAPRSQLPQLDEISQKIGELTAYTHEHRHGVNNLSTKFDALALDIAKRVEALDAKMTIRIDEVVKTLTADNTALSQRVHTLETAAEQQRGAKNVFAWFLQSPLIGWLVGAVAFILALLAKDHRI